MMLQASPLTLKGGLNSPPSQRLIMGYLASLSRSPYLGEDINVLF
jgi:hypothetical protein